MEATGGMVAGSHKRNELVRIRHDSDSGPKPLKDMNGQICQICGDTDGVTANGDFFVACNECAFPNPNYQQFPHPNAPVRPNPSPQVVEVCEGPTDSLGRRKWMPKEEMVLVGAFLTASVDSILGNDQKAESFWRRIVAYFNENSGSAQPRNLKQCKNKFHATMAKVTQFAGFYNTRASNWQSGASDEQIIADARADYRNANNNKEFPFEHIWKMVRKEPKWKQQHRFEALYQPGFADSYQSKKKTRVNEAGDYTSSDAPETPASQAESNTEFPTQPLDSEEPSHDPPPSVERRPMGQKAAKRNGKGKVGESSQSLGRIESVAEYYERLQLSINVHAEAIREKNAVNREKTKVAQQKARDKAYFKLIELEQKDTSNMTPAALEKHMVHIAYIREQHGFK